MKSADAKTNEDEASVEVLSYTMPARTSTLADLLEAAEVLEKFAADGYVLVDHEAIKLPKHGQMMDNDYYKLVQGAQFIKQVPPLAPNNKKQKYNSTTKATSPNIPAIAPAREFEPSQVPYQPKPLGRPVKEPIQQVVQKTLPPVDQLYRRENLLTHPALPAMQDTYKQVYSPQGARAISHLPPPHHPQFQLPQMRSHRAQPYAYNPYPQHQPYPYGSVPPPHHLAAPQQFPYNQRPQQVARPAPGYIPGPPQHGYPPYHQHPVAPRHGQQQPYHIPPPPPGGGGGVGAPMMNNQYRNPRQ